MKPLLDAQKLCIIRPPFMQIVGESLLEPVLAYSEEEGHLLIKKLDPTGAKQLTKQRFRGLASLPSHQLDRTCIDPKTRWAETMCVRDAEVCLKMLMPSASD